MLYDELQGFVDRSQQRQAAVQSFIDQQRIEQAASRPAPETSRSGGVIPSGSNTPVGHVPTKGKISLTELMNRIAMHESGGSYSATGSTVDSGDKAYGKYQIMGANIPSWTQQYLGHSLTPQQFLARQHAQDKVARGKLSYYYKKYGPGGAAAAWYGGESVAQDWQKYKQGYYYNSTGGTRFPSIFEYVKDILKGN